jgi:hypothetical protein
VHDARRPSYAKSCEGLIISALALNNKPISDGGKSLLRAMQLGPTVYPLVFACIAGRTLKTIALWKVERGTTVGVSASNIIDVPNFD